MEVGVGVSVWPELSATVGVAQLTTVLAAPDGIVTAWLGGQLSTGGVTSTGENPCAYTVNYMYLQCVLNPQELTLSDDF